MIRIYEFQDISEVIKFFGNKGDEWVNAEEFNEYLIERGHRSIKTLMGKKAYCERHGLPYKRMGKEYFFNIPSHSGDNFGDRVGKDRLTITKSMT